MSKKGFERLPTDEDWDDDDSPFVEAESHVVSVSRGGSRKRYCKSKLCMYDVIKKTNNTHKQLSRFQASTPSFFRLQHTME